MRVSLVLLLLASPALSAEHGETTVRVTAPRPLQPKSDDGRGTRMPLSEDPPGRLGTELRAIPGIFAVDPGNEGSAPAVLVRGLDASQNRWLVEDVPLDDAAYRSTPLLGLPSSIFDRVDGYPDGLPAERAVDGLGGGFVLRLPGRCDHSRVALRGGAYRYGRVFGDGCAHLAGGPLRVAGAYTSSREDFPYFDDGGTPLDPTDDSVRRRDGNSLNDIALATQWGDWDAKHGGVRIFSLHALNTRGLPGALEAPTLGARLEQRQHLVAVQGGDGVARFSVYAMAQDESSLDLPPAFAPFLPTATSQVTAGVFASGDWSGIRTSARVQLDRVQSTMLGGLRPERWRWQAPLALGMELTPGPITVTPELQLLTTGFSGDDGSSSYFSLVPRVSALWKLTANERLRFSAAIPSRMPSLSERYGSPGGFAASPTLGPERAVRVSAGYEKEIALGDGLARSLALAATAEWASVENLIVSMPVDAQTLRASNIGQAELRSAEVAAGLRFRGGWSLRGTVVGLSAENRTPIASQLGMQLPMRAPWRYSIGVGWQSGPWTVGYEILWRDAIYRDVANRDRLGAVADHSIRAALTTRSYGKFALEFLNVWNTIAAPRRFGAFGTVDHAGLAEGFPGPGRRIYLSWALDF